MGRWLPLSVNSDAIRAYVTEPPQGSGPGILLYGGEEGFNEALQKFAEQLGEEGYVVVAPDLANRPLTAEAEVAVAAAACDLLKTQPQHRGRIGGIGFGKGGDVVLRSLMKDYVACAAAYDPTEVENVTRLLTLGKSDIVIHRAAEGPNSASVDLDVDSYNRPIVYTYPDVRVGFSQPGSEAWNEVASSLAYSRSLTLLRSVIGPRFNLEALWNAHRACEFVTRDAAATMKTMVAEPYVNHVPTMTGGFGQRDLHRFYRDFFIPTNPSDMRNIPISQTVGADRVVNEGILCFTHDRRIDWLLPGVEPTGKYVEVALVGIITFRGGKLVHEHIYWDQASVLVQIGLLDPKGLPVCGAEAAQKVRDPSLPANHLLPDWND